MMKTKKFVILAVLLAGLLIAYAAFSVIFCYNTKPAVSEGNSRSLLPMNIWVKPKRFQVFTLANSKALELFPGSTTDIGMAK